MYRAAKRVAFEALFRSGAVHAFRCKHRGSVLVLIYHDVLPRGFPEQNPLFGMTVSTTEFEWQLRYVRKHYNPITFEEFKEWYFNKAPLPRNPVLITFDDGHRNNLDFALPILQRHQIPAICFVVAGFLGAKTLTWFEDAYYRLMFSASPSWRLNNGEVWPLNTVAQRAAACGRFFSLCRTSTQEQQSQELELLRSQLKVPELNGHYPGRFEFLSTEQLRFLRENGVEIGAHTLTHPVLATAPAATSKAEITEGKRRLEQILGTSVRAFAYPFGAPRLDFTEREIEYVRQSGLMVGFAGEGGLVRRSDNPFSLPRVGIGRMTRAQFAATITGTLDSIKKFASRAALA